MITTWCDIPLFRFYIGPIFKQLVPKRQNIDFFSCLPLIMGSLALLLALTRGEC